MKITFGIYRMTEENTKEKSVFSSSSILFFFATPNIFLKKLSLC